MTVTLRATATGVATFSSPRSVTKPGGIVSGDMILLALHLDSAIAPSTFPSGFTLVPSGDVTAARSVFVYYKIAGGSEPATYTFTFASGTGIVSLLAVYSSIGATLQVDSAAAAQFNASDTNRTWPSVSPSTPGYLACFGSIGANVATTPPGDMTELIDNSSAMRNYLMVKTLSAGGATGTKVATGTAAVSACSSVVVIEQTISSAAAMTLDAITLSAAGTVKVQGAASITLGAVTLAATGNVASTAILGAAAITLGAITLTAAGDLPPTAPSSLTATAITGSRIDLAWVDDDVGVGGYSIERSTNALTGFVEIGTSGVNSYSDTGLASNTRYYYKVRAVQA